MLILSLSDRDVTLSLHAEERLKERGITYAQVKAALQDADTETGNPRHPNGINYWKTFGDMKIKVSTTIDSGMEVVVTVCVYKKEG